MAITLTYVDAVGGSPEYAGRNLRQTVVGFYANGATDGRALGAGLGGLRPGTPTDFITADGTPEYHVEEFMALVDVMSADEAGSYIVANDATVTAAINAPHATLARIDLLSILVEDDVEDTSGNAQATIVYTAGTASGSPAAPATPANSFALAEINVPASGGGDPSVSVVATYISAIGGFTPVRTQAEADALAAAMGSHAEYPCGVYLDGTGYEYSVDAGSSWTVIGSGGDPAQQEYTSSGTWSKSAGLVAVRARVQAAGGAGGGAEATSSNQSSTGGGGGAGGYAEVLVLAASLGATEPVTIGAAGTGASGTNGGNASSSSFGTHAVATGGSGGTTSTASNTFRCASGGAGGSASAGDIQAAGSAGTTGISNGGNARAASGDGGGAHIGGGAGGSYVESSGADGVAGGNYGGGGSGAVNSVSQSARAGGNGGPAITIVEEYY